ncbi:MAG TPA: TSUP family transporter [Nevskiaceae bacterium]|nr:TSUP family transporter [Nevskiaceae bacterium]
MDPVLSALCAFSFLAGFIDSVVGGGGLIQVPALFVLMPQMPAATLLGTNKFSSIWGTLSATVQYMRRTPMEWPATLPACVAAFAFSFIGARTVAHLSSDFLRPLVLVMLALVLVYTLWKKDFGQLHAPRLTRSHQLITGLATGAVIGFYDGFFGPGTGSFLIFAFVGLFGFSFLSASASAKAVNVTTNAAALAYFITHGNVLYATAIPMAVCNVGGALLGSHLAIRKGSGFVRALFIVIVCALIARMARDYFF